MKERAKIIVLYNELAQYFLVCLGELCDQMQTEAIVVAYPQNSEAPFAFVVNDKIKIKNRLEYSRIDLLDLIRNHQPKLLFVGGWFDKDYLRVAKESADVKLRLLGFDNQWNGSLRQVASAVYAKQFIKPLFDIAFVPGEQQKKLAKKLGFDNESILKGAYSADTDVFSGFYSEMTAKEKVFPKRFLYLGRYVKHKGIFDLWDAFVRFKVEFPEWELWCVGAGEEFDNRVESDGIRHLGFKQPSELLPILQETGVYILPSHFEPWGVSVHEMAVAGFPMLLSDAIGSKESFLVKEENGFEFKSRSSESIFNAMKKIAKLDPTSLKQMSIKSHELGMRITPKIWASNLLSFISK